VYKHTVFIITPILTFPLAGGRDALFSRLLVWKYKFQDDKRS
jgi:hypothetical protein